MTPWAASHARGIWAAPTSVLTLAVVVWAAGPPTAHAQRVDGADSMRPYRGLFGANAPERASGPHSLNLSGSVFGGYDDDIFARGRGPRSGNARVGGTFAGSQLAARYAMRTPRSTFSVGGGTALRYLTSTKEFIPTSYSANVGYTRELGARTSLALRHGVGYRPFFSIVPFAGGSTLGSSFNDTDDLDGFDEVGSENPDDFTLAADRRAVRQSGSVGLSHQLSRRARVSARGGYTFADFRSSEFDDINGVRWRGAVNFSYSLTRFASFRLGYGYQQFAPRAGRSAGNHNINLGIAYNRPFVMQRGQTRLSFTTGTSLLARERLEGESGSVDRLALRATGTASLVHMFNPNWQAQASYVRSVGFLDGLAEPLQGDLVTVGLGGLLTTRTDVSASVGYVSGAIGLRQRNFNTALGNVRVRTALTERLALFAQYFYYQYAFNDAIADRLIVAPELERQGVRAGLTFWWPLIR